MDGEFDELFERLRARVEAERRRVEELSRQSAERRAKARAVRDQAAAAVDAAITRQRPRR